jgi:hypothetical protein
LGYIILRGDPCYFRACWYQTCAPTYAINNHQTFFLYYRKSKISKHFFFFLFVFSCSMREKWWRGLSHHLFNAQLGKTRK